MRRDGDVTFFQVEHRHGPDDGWAISDLAHFLFGDLTLDQRRGPVGERYRALLGPQSASTALWQHYGINGFVEKDDGLRVLQEMRALPSRGEYEFRLVERRVIQETRAVA